jgi:acyl-CoA hydrolase
VAIDQYGKPLQVPLITPVTSDDVRRYEEATLRRQQRLQTRELLKQARNKY